MNALSESAQLAHWNFDRFACVVDPDLGVTTVPPVLGPRYYPYLGADLEAMLTAFSCLAEVLLHLGSEDKITACGGPQVLVKRICDNAGVVASLREHNERHNWGLPFDKVDLQGKVDRNSLELKVGAYCAALLSAAREDTDATQGELLKAAALPPSGPHLFHGKDVACFAGVALRSKAGTLPLAAASGDLVAATLRASSGLKLAASDWLRGLLELLEH